MERLVATAQDRWSSPPEGFIKSIRFPYYRNMEQDASLDFSFPISIFTGQNGCGKSSVLQALYGAPGGYSVGRYWFSTDVDPIADSPDGRRPSFVYEYVGVGSAVFCPIKTRIRRKFSTALLNELRRDKSKDPDKTYDPNYWEPSRPLAWAGLPARVDRDPTVQREVIYLHFRTQLSAFESAFYGSGTPSTSTREYLRIKSRHLLRAFEGRNPHKPRGKNQSKIPETVDGEAIAEVNRVVGKDYVGATIVEHKLFGSTWGPSVRFKLADASYSDAFAGSGESAILRLIIALQRAPEGALIVLDEPEISLHPEAQHRMKLLLLQYAVHKNLQVFLATHSSHFVDGFPEEAVFIFQRGPSGRFQVQNSPADLAMVSIGHKVERRCVLVEDTLARAMVERALRGINENAIDLVDVRVVPGGASAVYSALALDQTGKVVAVLDGDQQPDEQCLTVLRQLVNQTLVSRKDWQEALVAATCNQMPTFHQSGNSVTGEAAESEADLVRRRFAQAVLDRVSYMPGGGHPEDIIATEHALRPILAPLMQGSAASAVFDSGHRGKALIMAAAQASDVQYGSLVDMLLARWAKEKGEDYDTLQSTMRSVLGHA